MKKLLTLAVVAATAGLVQAASLNWSAMAIYQPKENSTDPNVALSGGLAYLFVTAQGGDYGAATTTKAAVTDLLDSKKAVVYTDEGKTYIKSSEDTTGANKIQVAGIGATTSTGMLSGDTGYNSGNFGAGDSLTAFAVIFDTASFDTAKNYIATAEKSASWTSSTGAKTLGFQSQANNAWKAVPEPATATLALAGLALLLKRRRA